MLKPLIIFGSKSDKEIYTEMREFFKEKNIDYDIRICSAHRTPEILDQIMKTDHRLIIAGAGLAAHLPGVIASKTLKPVIGIPVKAAFDGLDSLLSIIQMPPGVPVLSVGPDQTKEAAIFAEKVLMEIFQKVNILSHRHHKAVEKCKDIFKKFGVPYTEAQKTDVEAININFVELKNKAMPPIGTVINVPITDGSEAKDALKLHEATKKGVWVGLNRGENAALATLQIMNTLDNKYEKELMNYREEMKAKVVKDDKELENE